MRKIILLSIIGVLVLSTVAIIVFGKTSDSSEEIKAKDVEVTIPPFIIEYIYYYPSDYELGDESIGEGADTSDELTEEELALEEGEEIDEADIEGDATEEDVTEEEIILDEDGTSDEEFMEEDTEAFLSVGDDLTNFIQDNNISNATWNEDGSLTISMSEERFTAWKAEHEAILVELFSLMAEDSFLTYIDKIEPSEDFTQVKIFVDKVEYEEEVVDSSFLELGFAVMYFQAFTGVDPYVEIILVDKKTSEEFEKFVFPESFEEMVEYEEGLIDEEFSDEEDAEEEPAE